MKYDHIIEMEKILNEHSKKLIELKDILDFLENNFEKYSELSNYYHSKQRFQDLDDDEAGLIPDNIRRGVLSEDGIYNLISDYYEAAIQMLELSIKFIKNR